MYPIDFFWRAALAHPLRTALVHPSGEMTFSELAGRVLRRAAGLVRRDASLGSHVAVSAANSVDHLVTIMAVLAAGKVWIPLNPRNGDPELRRMIEFVSPSLVVADETMAERLASPLWPVTLEEELDQRSADSEAVPLGPGSAASVPLHATQSIKFTGGTTGVPKGVEQSYRCWNTNLVTNLHELGPTPADRYLVVAPLTHGTSTYMLPLLARGGALVFPDGAKPAMLLDTAEATGASILFGPPTLLAALADEQRRAPRRLPMLRMLIYGAAPMRPAQIGDVQGVFGPVVATTYGQTEAPQIVSFLRPEEMTGDALGSVGRPTLLTKVAVLRPDGTPSSSGEDGEIAVKGDLVMSGYHKRPEETARTVVNGWLMTGDIGHFRDGLLYIGGRSKDVIITGGFNVYPGDVETVLASHPAVLECAVVGVPDERWGEAVHAAVQPRPGLPFDAAEVSRFLRNELGPVKVPKAFHVVDALPRTPLGKVLRPALRDEIRRRLGSEQGRS